MSRSTVPVENLVEALTGLALELIVSFGLAIAAAWSVDLDPFSHRVAAIFVLFVTYRVIFHWGGQR